MDIGTYFTAVFDAGVNMGQVTPEQFSSRLNAAANAMNAGATWIAGLGFDRQICLRHGRQAVVKPAAQPAQQVDRAELFKLSAARINDPALLLFGRNGELDEHHGATEWLDRRTHALGEAGIHRCFGGERKYERPPDLGRCAERLKPEALTQLNERLCAKREYRAHSVDDEVIVEQGQASNFRKLATYRELSSRCAPIDEDDFRAAKLTSSPPDFDPWRICTSSPGPLAKRAAG